MTTRINYNQGQVSASFSSMTVLRSVLANHGAAFAERQDHRTGEWFPCNPANGAFLDMTAPENKEHPARLFSQTDTGNKISTNKQTNTRTP